MRRPPSFIVVEGPEGVGKSTLVKALGALYRGAYEVVLTREPGGTPIGEEFRRVLKDPKHQGQFPPLAELFGFLAARAAFVDRIVKPALAAGKIILTDRFSLSTMAYQISGRGLPEAECLQAIRLAEGGVRPRYIVLMARPEIGLARKKKQADDGDRFAQEDRSFHQKVYAGYLKYARLVGADVIDTDELDREQVYRRACALLSGA